MLQDYNSLFPLDDTQPSKLMRLLSSNEDEPVALSSPGQLQTPGFNSWLNNAACDLLVFRDYSLVKALTESENMNNLAVRNNTVSYLSRALSVNGLTLSTVV